jgi:sec-independent protein translocase protein TatC
MFVLKKIFQARENMANRRSRWDDVEKPFLDHLEDLRKMLFKTVITLAVAMLCCFVFNQQLLEIIRHPIRIAGLDSIDGNRLPETIAQRDWGRIRELARAAGSLEPEARAAFFANIPDEWREAVHATLWFRASLALPLERRAVFIEAAAPPGPARDTALFLIEENPRAEMDKSGELLRMTALGPAETFSLSIKLSFFAGIVVSFPLLLYYLAEFILPGLTQRERRLLLPSVGVGFLLFLTGVLFAYFVVIPRALVFFHQYSLSLGVIDDWRIGIFVSFVTQFTLIFGLCFELPVVVMAMVKLGLLGYTKMASSRSHAILSIVVVAAILTPTTDALTLGLLALPMIVLYEICIWLAWFIERADRRREAREEQEWQERMLHPAIAADATTTGGDPGPPPGDPPEDPPDEPVPSPAPGLVPAADPDGLPANWGNQSDPYDDPYRDPYGDAHQGDQADPFATPGSSDPWAATTGPDELPPDDPAPADPAGPAGEPAAEAEPASALSQPPTLSP